MHAQTEDEAAQRNRIDDLKKAKGGTLLLVNDRPNVSALECFGDVSFFQSVDDLNLANHLAILQNFKARAFDD